MGKLQVIFILTTATLSGKFVLRNSSISQVEKGFIMKEYQKIRNLLKEKKLKLTALHKRITQVFGENAVTYRTLQRIIAGQTKASASSLYQVCVGLGITLRGLKAGSEKEDSLPAVVRRAYPLGFYVYNEKTQGKILADPESGPRILKLVLKPKGATKTEQTSGSKEDRLRWVYCLKGEVTCVIEGRKYLLKRGDSLSFDGRLKHSLANETRKTSACLILQKKSSKNPIH